MNLLFGVLAVMPLIGSIGETCDDSFPLLHYPFGFISVGVIFLFWPITLPCSLPKSLSLALSLSFSWPWPWQDSSRHRGIADSI